MNAQDEGAAYMFRRLADYGNRTSDALEFRRSVATDLRTFRLAGGKHPAVDILASLNSHHSDHQEFKSEAMNLAWLVMDAFEYRKSVETQSRVTP